MSSGNISALLTCCPPRPEQSLGQLGRLKRKLSPPLYPIWLGEVSYPSPPMSNPPSPPRPPQDQPSTTTSEPQLSTTPLSAATSSFMPTVALAAPSLGRPYYDPAVYAPITTLPPSSTSPALVSTSSAVPSQQGSASVSSVQPDQTSSSSARPAGFRGGRKAKAHVASACINCKRAHLSCDVNRPCSRCVASGKQDSCYDVQHKKRGRPRLREEGEFKVEQMRPESGSSTTGPVGGTEQQTRRPIAATRPRRAESFRSIRSQGSDVSGVTASPTYPYPPPPTATQATFGFPYPPPPPLGPIGYEVPTAYLDLDLNIIKANAPFCWMMSNGQDVARRHLNDIARPLEGEAMQSIQAQLVAERDAREPAYMPPIVQIGQDPLQGALESDVERYTQGFSDRTYTFTRAYGGLAAEPFPARVRLAKANVYFVAVTLPALGPAPAQPPPTLFTRLPAGPQLQTQTPDSYNSPRMPAIQSAPAPAYLPFPGAVPLPTPPRSMGHQPNRSYPPPQPPLPYQQQPQQQRSAMQPYPAYPPPNIGTPRLSVAEPPTETTAFTPRTAARELPQASPAGVQLPPIVGNPIASSEASAPSARTSNIRTTEVTTGAASGDEEGDGTRSPRKRRRMGIDDVLHR